jgi:hypothetical protein
VKINVDGVVSTDNTRGSFSAVCRNAKGEYMGSYAVLVEGLMALATHGHKIQPIPYPWGKYPFP